MAIQSIDQNVLDEVNADTAVRILMAQWWRELKMLRQMTKDQLFASSHCPICFRDYPHSFRIHDYEGYALRSLPNKLFNGDEFVETELMYRRGE